MAVGVPRVGAARGRRRARRLRLLTSRTDACHAATIAASVDRRRADRVSHRSIGSACLRVSGFFRELPVHQLFDELDALEVHQLRVLLERGDRAAC